MKKGHQQTVDGLFSVFSAQKSDRRNGINRAGIYTCTTINAGIRIDVMLAAAFAYGVDRTRINTGATVGAVTGNRVSHEIHPFRSN